MVISVCSVSGARAGDHGRSHELVRDRSAGGVYRGFSGEAMLRFGTWKVVGNRWGDDSLCN